jgi:hypothetical protein
MHKLTWQQKLILIAGGAFMLYAMGYMIYAALVKPQHKVEIIHLGGVDAGAVEGMTDADLEKADKSLMAFSSFTTERNNNLTRTHLNVDLAISPDNGKVWYLNTRVFAGRYDEFIDQDGITPRAEGTWRYEQPTIVYDPKDKTAPYKVFAYKYFWNISEGAALARQSGSIVYKSATTLSPANWSNEMVLFSASPTQPPRPYNQMVKLTLNRLSPNLQNYIAYADPSAIVTERGLLLVLSAFTADDLQNPNALILIGSQDHGQSWAYIGTLLTRADLQKIDFDTAAPYTHFKAPTLFEKDNAFYLMLSLGNQTVQNDGAHVFAFDDLYQARLKRDDQGALIPTNHLKLDIILDNRAFGIGQGAYVDGIDGGVYMTQIRNGKYNIYQTKKSPLKDEK